MSAAATAGATDQSADVEPCANQTETRSVAVMKATWHSLRGQLFPTVDIR